MGDFISLYELNCQVKESLQTAFQQTVWVVAEISELKVNRNGHCYLELVEKEEGSDYITAKASATIWAYTFRMLKPYFETATGYNLEAGIKILVRVSVEFHEMYGFSLNIKDIDPTYTLGDIEKLKLETIRKLEEDGVINMNKDLEIPDLVQKIAIVSSPTAAGLEDFTDQLNNNPEGFKFYTMLFPAIMQGPQAEGSIVHALDAVFQFEDFFDVLVIIRGGGSQSDLSCFDNYVLASNIAQFPLPVLTGIGHEKDESIVDLVAHTKFKTPTAVAGFLIQRVQKLADNVCQKEDYFKILVNTIIEEEKQSMEHLMLRFVPEINLKIEKQKGILKNNAQKLISLSKRNILKEETSIQNMLIYFQNKSRLSITAKMQQLELIQKDMSNHVIGIINEQKWRLDSLNQKNNLLDPKNILKRGYSVVKKEGEIIADSKQVSAEDILSVQFYKGEIRTKVIK